MKKSKFLRLHLNDFTKGMIVAILTGVGTFLTLELQTGRPVDIMMLKRVGVTAVVALIAYLTKNLFTNVNDEFLTTDKS